MWLPFDAESIHPLFAVLAPYFLSHQSHRAEWRTRPDKYILVRCVCHSNTYLYFPTAMFLLGLSPLLVHTNLSCFGTTINPTAGFLIPYHCLDAVPLNKEYWIAEPTNRGSYELTIMEPVWVCPRSSTYICYDCVAWCSCGTPISRSGGCLWLFCLLLRPFCSYCIVSFSLDRRAWFWYYWILLCHVWLILLGGLLFSEEKQREESWI